MGVLNRPAIKAEARSFISHDTKWWKMFLATVVIYLIGNSVNLGYKLYGIIDNGAIQYFNDYYNNNTTAESDGVSIFSTILNIIVIPFSVAMAGYYLNHIRGFNPDWRSLYKEAFDNFGTYISVGFLTNVVIILWGFLFVIPGIVMAFAYSQVRYIIHDNKNLSAGEAMKISKIMTQGYKSDLFVLGLSFIPWIVLVLISAGIAGIYVAPYINVTSAMFYENLKQNAIDKGLVAPEAFGLAYDNFQQNDFNAPQGTVNPQGTFYQQNCNYQPNQPVNNSNPVINNQTAPFTPPAPEDTFNPDSVFPEPSDKKDDPSSDDYSDIL